MAGKKTKKHSKSTIKKKAGADAGVIDNIWGVILVAIGIFLFAAVQFQAAGEFGVYIGNFLKGIFGLIGIIVPWYLIIYGIMLFTNKTVHISWWSAAVAFIMLLMFCLINSGRFIDSDNIYFSVSEFYTNGRNLSGGGLFGMPIAMALVKYLGKVGLYIVALVIICISLLLLINTPISQWIASFKHRKENRINAKLEWQAEQERLALEREKEQLKIQQEREKKYKEIEKNRAGIDKMRSKMKPDGQLSFADNGIEDIKPFDYKDEDDPLKKPTDEKKGNKIFALLKDVTLFKKKEEKEDDLNSHRDAITDLNKSYGLPEEGFIISTADMGLPSDVEPLTGKVSSESLGGDDEKTYGLEHSEKKPGFGLDGDGPKIHVSGYGLDDDTYSLDEGTDFNKIEPIKGDEENIFDLHSKRDRDFINKNRDIETPDMVNDNESSLTNKEAKNLNLTSKDFNRVKTVNYKKPPMSLLSPIKKKNRGNLGAELQRKAATLEETLRSFNVDAKVVEVTQGPAVTRYEIQPNVGVKVSSIVRLADDIALNLRAKSIRMEAPIPGKAAVGIEVENESINMVSVRELLESNEFLRAESKISFAVGKDIAGKSIVADLKTMPHLLIAGSTGSGKSVCINSIIASLLYKANPDEVKLVLIDPKVVELGNYNGIPHLLVPVVTDPSKAAATLNWAVAEMTKRYKLFADAGVRDLASYNQFIKRGNSDAEIVPQIVIIIDELADLMMAAPSQVEESICRLAQMARAAGMHLIVATQRPSVDIITGVIKANIPSRIAFAVSSQFDSRTILDMAGAEKLVGKGDMLFNPLGSGKPLRVQGCFISDNEVNAIIEYVKNQSKEIKYSEDLIETIEKGNVSAMSSDDKTDELLPEAIDFVINAGQASVSMIQRRFRVGYNRGARIMDMMEERGIVGPQDGSRPRQILVTKEEMENGNEKKEEE